MAAGRGPTRWSWALLIAAISEAGQEYLPCRWVLGSVTAAAVVLGVRGTMVLVVIPAEAAPDPQVAFSVRARYGGFSRFEVRVHCGDDGASEDVADVLVVEVQKRAVQELRRLGDQDDPTLCRFAAGASVGWPVVEDLAAALDAHDDGRDEVFTDAGGGTAGDDQSQRP